MGAGTPTASCSRPAVPTVTYRATEAGALWAAVATEAERQAAAHPERRDVRPSAMPGATGRARRRNSTTFLEGFGVQRVVLGEGRCPGHLLGARDRQGSAHVPHRHRPGHARTLLKSLAAEGIADKESPALLATDRVIPVVHGITYEDLRDESPLLASRSGLSTGEDTLEQVAVKIANAVRPEAN